MKSSLPINYNGKKIDITVRKLLYHEKPAWGISQPDGNDFILKQDEDTWVPIVEGETDTDLVHAVIDAILLAEENRIGAFASHDFPAPPPVLF